MTKGMTTAQALSLSTREINRMSVAQLRKVVSVTRSTTRKRYERLQETTIHSPAKEYLWRSAKGEEILPSVKGMNKTELINEYKRQRHFLELKTSTVKGTKQAQREVKTTTEEITGRDLSDAEVTEVWRIVGELKDNEMGGVLNYKQAAEETANIIKENADISHGDLFEQVQQRMIDIYEQEQSARSVYTSRKFN